MKVPCGKNVETGERIFVSDVSPGECILPRVICPVCETPLQAKKGHQTIHHFAHMPVTGPERKSAESGSKQEALRKDFAAFLAKGQVFSRKEQQVLEDVTKKHHKKLERLGVARQRVEDYLKV